MNDFFTFSYRNGDTCVDMRFSAETWHESLEQFVSFLGNVHGYDVRPKIAADIGPFVLNSERWSGPVFNPEEEM